ncbi:triphosphoribosyl-dephospho-CoA synthase [Ihubacter sp. rT4E-8]|uniref:triphosphoribosyl-dephospho-CoA synthase n=1 Tax=Ihubacter sp. rT4E-8 TaxID=3242369 RepID=UPI003CEF5693
MDSEKDNLRLKTMKADEERFQQGDIKFSGTKAHSPETIGDTIADTIAETIGQMAVQALRIEAALTPKPGLVDQENSGAHDDMDYPLFLASSAALLPCFTACAKIGMQSGKKKPAQLTSALRRAGRCGETAMYAATRGVNSHKGAIFSMGILCCAVGMLQAAPAAADAASIGAAIGQNAGKLRHSESSVDMTRDKGEFAPLQDSRQAAGFHETELQALCAKLSAALLRQDPAAATHGLYARGHAACGGVRAEARSGFASAFQTGLPVLREAIASGIPQQRALIKTLLVLMSRVEDSNAAYRGGAEGLDFIRSKAQHILSRADWQTEECLDMVRDFDRACIRRHLSPGGSADLLAFSIMLYMIFDEVLQ